MRYCASNWLKERNYWLNRSIKAEVAVIDSYLAGRSFYEEVSRKVKLPMYLDDNSRIEYPRGVIINGNIYGKEVKYSGKAFHEYLLGAEYLPLRKEFWSVPERKLNINIRSILVTFGGEDSRGLIPKVLKILYKKFPEINKKVIIGRRINSDSRMRAYQDKKTEFIYSPDAAKLRKIMLESDIAISAGGQTLYELARTGLAAVAIASAENQLNNVRKLEKAGLIEYAGYWNGKHTLENVGTKIGLLADISVRRERAELGKKYVDGNGSLRIASWAKEKLSGLL
jgi:UDP-2,4-diacetamido-2,4,6-trideoxy-beta-L-altropyranose hydrolase